ncbi:MAG: hypothetical protein ACRC3Y_17845 [Romboutsia sp.]|uniref:hypothetical protein n=1 Tax=Romboutsia sp. TaxID=1965302 RepID=UPI003F2A874F
MKSRKSFLALVFILILLLVPGCSKQYQSEEVDINNKININDLSAKKTIPVDIDLLKNNEPLLLGEYELNKNNFIVYNINATGGGNINIGFTKEKEYDPDKLLIGHFGYTSTALKNDILDLSSIESITDGIYYLWISSYEGDLKDIKGEVLIAD